MNASSHQPRVLIPDAVLGRRYADVPWDGKRWLIVHEQITHPEGLEAIACTILAKAIGDLASDTILLFRPISWDGFPGGLPDFIPSDYLQLLLPGGVMDGSSVLALLLAAVEAQSVIEFRAAGPDASAVMDRVQTGMAAINARAAT